MNTATKSPRAPGRWTAIAQLTRLELASVRRSRWLSFTLAVYAVLMGIFVLVGMRESSVLGFTGLGRVFLNFSHAILLLLPLLALSATAQVLPAARDDGTLEMLMSQPVSRRDYFIAVALSRLAALILPLIALALLVGLFGNLALGQALPWHYLLTMIAACSTLILAFVGIGLLISTVAQNQSRALIYALVAWAVGVALLDFGLIGMMLQWRLNPQTVFALALLNPVQSARFVLLASAEPQLSILGPVGFFMVNKLGSTWLTTLSLAWPTVVGATTLFAAWRHFRGSDLV